ncbi:fimbrial-like protein [Morganella morganii]
MITNIIRLGYAVLCITGLLLSVFGIMRPAAAGSDSAVINFSAVFVGGSCEISASVPEIVFGGGELIEPDEIVSNPLPTAFNLTLTGCGGWGLTPKVTVSGESTTLFGPALFRSSMPESASDGYGILLSTLGNNSFNANTNLADTKVITAKNWSMDTDLSGLDTILPVTATLTCGDCNYSGRRSGDLIASVTFDFVYD